VKAAGPIRVDGDPGEWNLGELTEPVRGGRPGSGDFAMVGYEGATLYYAGFWTGGVLPAGPADHGARVYGRHDAERLYFLVRCDDDDIRLSEGPDTNWRTTAWSSTSTRATTAAAPLFRDRRATSSS